MIENYQNRYTRFESNPTLSIAPSRHRPVRCSQSPHFTSAHHSRSLRFSTPEHNTILSVATAHPVTHRGVSLNQSSPVRFRPDLSVAALQSATSQPNTLLSISTEHFNSIHVSRSGRYSSLRPASFLSVVTAHPMPGRFSRSRRLDAIR